MHSLSSAQWKIRGGTGALACADHFRVLATSDAERRPLAYLGPR